MNSLAHKGLVLITGQYGSGKTTLGIELAKHLDVPHISCGDIMRNLSTHTDPKMRNYGERNARGDWFTDDEMLDLLGIPGYGIMDGYPRMIGPAHHLAKNRTVTAILNLDIADGIALARTEERWAQEHRREDAPDKREKRTALYNERMPAVLAFYDEIGIPFFNIDATQSTHQVLQHALVVLKTP